MQLTKQTDFAFRTLIYLAALPAEELTSIAHICKYYEVSPNHLSKVVQKLAKMGVVDTVRGKGGGIRLAKPPNEVELVDVLCAIEPVLSAVNCAEPLCKISPYCRLKGVLDDAMSAFVDSLRGYTLADIALKELRSEVVCVQ